MAFLGGPRRKGSRSLGSAGAEPQISIQESYSALALSLGQIGRFLLAAALAMGLLGRQTHS